MESSGCQVFYGLRLQVVWAARCLHGVPSGKDRHAAASFACEASAACTQPFMYCECTVSQTGPDLGGGCSFHSQKSSGKCRAAQKQPITLSIVLCPAGPRSVTLSVREYVKSEGLWLKAGACCHWVESGNLPLSFLNNCLMASEPLNFWRNAKKLLQLTVLFQGLLSQLMRGKRK